MPEVPQQRHFEHKRIMRKHFGDETPWDRVKRMYGWKDDRHCADYCQQWNDRFRKEHFGKETPWDRVKRMFELA